jgi:3-hydroxyacyl-[acyl-carrier-protein] dehydratase
MNDFYRASALEQAEGRLSCSLHFEAAHDIFRGHFPGNPIVPGVCTMAIIKALLEKALGKKLQLSESKTVKFLGLILPSMSPQAHLSWKADDMGIHATASLQDTGAPLFKMTATYLPAAAFSPQQTARPMR